MGSRSGNSGSQSPRSSDYGYSGTLAGVTVGVDNGKLGTDCHYSTPVGGFTISKSGGSGNCDPTAPAPKGIGGSYRR